LPGAVFPHPGVDERQAKCRSDGLEGTADKYRGFEGGEVGAGDEGEVLEELGDKVVNLKVEVEAGRWECEAWYITGCPSSVR
jgi:hypothetical protein